MRKSLLPLVLMVASTLAGCGEQPANETESKPAALSAPPVAPIAPGKSGLIPASAGEFVVATVQQQQSLRSADAAPCAVDQLNKSGARDGMHDIPRSQNLNVIGWILSQKKEAPREFALALVGKSVIYLGKGAGGRARPDVARVHAAASATPSGYVFTAPLRNVPSGEYEVVMVQDTHNVLSRCKSGWKVRVTEPS